jgi:hypothetical protein
MADVQASSSATIPVVRFLQKGQIVHVYGIPVRLTQGVDVETSQDNVKLIDEREIGVTLADQLKKVPALSEPLPAAAPPKQEVADVLEYLRQKEQEAERTRKQVYTNPPAPWPTVTFISPYRTPGTTPDFTAPPVPGSAPWNTIYDR